MPEFVLPPAEFDSVFERRFMLSLSRIVETCTPVDEVPGESGCRELGRGLGKVIGWHRRDLNLDRVRAARRKHRFNPFGMGRRIQQNLTHREALDAQLAAVQSKALSVQVPEKARELIEAHGLEIQVDCLADEIVFEGERLSIGDRLFYVTYWGADLPIVETFQVVGFGFQRITEGRAKLLHYFHGEDRTEGHWTSTEIAELRAGTYRGRWSDKKAFLDEAEARAFATQSCQDWIAALQERQAIFQAAEPLPPGMNVWREK